MSEDSGTARIVIENTGNTAVFASVRYGISWCQMFDVLYQTLATVSHRDIQTPRRELKIRRAAEYF